MIKIPRRKRRRLKTKSIKSFIKGISKTKKEFDINSFATGYNVGFNTAFKLIRKEMKGEKSWKKELNAVTVL